MEYEQKPGQVCSSCVHVPGFFSNVKGSRLLARCRFDRIGIGKELWHDEAKSCVHCLKHAECGSGISFEINGAGIISTAG